MYLTINPFYCYVVFVVWKDKHISREIQNVSHGVNCDHLVYSTLNLGNSVLSLWVVALVNDHVWHP